MHNTTNVWGLAVNNLFNRIGKACQRLSPGMSIAEPKGIKTVDMTDLPATSPKVFPLVMHANIAAISIRYESSFPIFPHPLLLRPRIERI